MSDTETPKTCRVLSIDAWRAADGGWDWNNWHAVGTVPAAVADYSPRKLLAYMRQAGYLKATSAGRCAVFDDQYNLVIQQRGNGMPLFAIEYGPLEFDGRP